MPTRRSRFIDETHPIAGVLFRGLTLDPGETLELLYATPVNAWRVYRALVRFRTNVRLGPPGSFPASDVDPAGEGRGHFDVLKIGCRKGDRIVRIAHVQSGQGSGRASLPQAVEERVVL